MILPKLSDFRLIESNKECGVSTYRLHTNVYLSHGIWTEACSVEIGILLDFRDTTSTILNASQTIISANSKPNSIKSTKSEDNLIIDLCEPIQVYVSPKQPRKGVI